MDFVFTFGERSDESSLNEVVDELIGKHGIDAVKAAIKNAAKGARGRPRIDDYELALPFLKKEMLEWLSGGDIRGPGRVRRMAMEIARASNGHSLDSVQKRMENRLRDARIPEIVRMTSSIMMAHASYDLLINTMKKAMKDFSECKNYIDGIIKFATLSREKYQSHFGVLEGDISVLAMCDRLRERDEADMQAIIGSVQQRLDSTLRNLPAEWKKNPPI